MKRILMLATGGTIACRDNGGGYQPALDGATLLAAVPERFRRCEITVRDLMCVDSTDCTTEQRAEIARAVWENRADYDGFIVTHGTDTMAYTAAVLYRALECFDKPVIVTGSMHPLGEPGSDAEGNLCGAIAAACSDYRGAAVLCGG
ncbi:MAG: asparaginase domain-containing protein, partial [Butyricicoccaceae bacterium]